jgi:hypothetical protein
LSGITLDAGGMIASDRNDRRVIALIARTVERANRSSRAIPKISGELLRDWSWS